jgi:prepilin-type N-terminal cleavage/methylation domain-containing protein
VRARGFSLIEVMVVVAIVGVLSALAGPNLLIEVQKVTLTSASDTVASFIARAQNEAMVSRRCVRVRVTAAQQLTLDRLNTFDCDNDPASASKIDGGASVFLPVAVLNLESPSLLLTFDGTGGSQVPSECSPAPGGSGAEIRFRPNGRVYSGDSVMTDDDAVLVISHTKMPTDGDRHRQNVLVNGNGLICVLKRGEALLGSAPDFSCP